MQSILTECGGGKASRALDDYMTGAYDTRGSPFYSLIPAELAAFDIDDGWGESAFEGFLGDSFSSSYPNGSCDLLHAVPSSFVVVL